LIALRRFPPSAISFAHWLDVAGLGIVIIMQLDETGFELTDYILDSPLNRGMVGAVTGHEFYDNGP
jgi:hypothetical protein